MEAFYFVCADHKDVEKVVSSLTAKSALQKFQLGVGTETTLRNQSAKRALEEFLAALDFSSLTPEVQGELLQEIASTPFLKHLSFSGSPVLNDRHLQSISRICTKLHSLRIISCSKITTAGLSIFSSKQNIKITVGNCPQLGLEAYQFLSAHFKNFSIELSQDDIVRLKDVPNPFDLAQKVWEKDKEMGKKLIAALVFSDVKIPHRSIFERLLTKFENPVELLVEGDRLRECLPSKETYERARKWIVKEAYLRDYAWVKTFEDSSYLAGAVWKTTLEPKQKNEGPLGWIPRRFEKLTSLNLCDIKNVSKKEAETLCQRLNLTELVLNSEQVTDFVPLKLNHFGELVGRISTDEIFKIGNTNIKLEGIKPKGARKEEVMAIAGLLLVKPEITSLRLENCLHHSNHLMVLAKVLPLCSVKILSLPNNCLTAAQIKELARSLPQSSISQLDLSGNSIGNEGCKELACSLPQSSLSLLFLSFNSIGNEGCKELARSLPQSSISQQSRAKERLEFAKALLGTLADMASAFTTSLEPLKKLECITWTEKTITQAKLGKDIIGLAGSLLAAYTKE